MDTVRLPLRAPDVRDAVHGFVRALPSDAHPQAIAAHLCECVTQATAIRGAAVAVRDEVGRPRLASTDAAVGGILARQVTQRQGPWGDADDRDLPVRVERTPSLRGTRGEAGGVTALYALPLFGDGQRLGVLALAQAPEGLTARDLALAQVLVDIAGDRLATARTMAKLMSVAKVSLYRSLHDPLTGLANRILLLDRAHHALARARGQDVRLVVLLCDLDGFKQINDRFGHPAGDALLVAVAARLRGAVRAGDTLARLGGDEFVVLCEDDTDCLGPAALARRIARALDPPFAVGGDMVSVAASIGVAVTDGTQQDLETLLREADSAMYRAKRRGGGTSVLQIHPDREPATVIGVR